MTAKDIYECFSDVENLKQIKVFALDFCSKLVIAFTKIRASISFKMQLLNCICLNLTLKRTASSNTYCYFHLCFQI